jgi:hypothetical protein
MLKAVYALLLCLALLLVSEVGFVGYKIATGHAQDLDTHRVIIIKEGN